MKYRALIVFTALLASFFLLAALFSLWGVTSGETAIVELAWTSIVSITLFAVTALLQRKFGAKK